MKLVVIVGPTATGKTSLAIKIAKTINGEIICADSRTVYKYLDIGTAKPTDLEQSQAKHHLINIVEPNDNFNVADFKKLADKLIVNINIKGKVPIMVGGSGLYVNSVVYDYKFADKNAPKDPNNPRHLASHAITPISTISNEIIFVGLNTDRSKLKNQISKRADKMISLGLIDEVRFASNNYPNSKALLAPAYKAFIGYLNGTKTIEQSKNDFVTNDLQLAKRQVTWFKRDPNIVWFEDPNLAYEYILNQITDKE
jgi:tRNA dimethylallyltransferase